MKLKAYLFRVYLWLAATFAIVGLATEWKRSLAGYALFALSSLIIPLFVVLLFSVVASRKDR